ncbi:MAG: urease accessory protein UreD [Bryobacteraceae bacterium]|jgi:urease accessory protein
MQLHLLFELDKRGSTILRVKTQRPPWRVVRGFDAPSGERLAHIHNVSGGILDSDALEWRVEVGPGAQAQLTSTGATRVYRSRARNRVATQRAIVTLGEDAYFEYLPDQLIPFAGSRFEQSTRIELARGASLIWWELIAPGRDASGELFGYESLASTFSVCACGEPVATERWNLVPQSRPLDSMARLGPYRYFASCYICRAGEGASYWRTLENELQLVADRSATADVSWGITSLRKHGLLIRGVAMSGRRLSDGLVEFWRAAKWSLCGRAATLPRKVH